VAILPGFAFQRALDLTALLTSYDLAISPTAFLRIIFIGEIHQKEYK
jgi:hypothetical protein